MDNIVNKGFISMPHKIYIEAQWPGITRCGVKLKRYLKLKERVNMKQSIIYEFIPNTCRNDNKQLYGKT